MVSWPVDDVAAAEEHHRGDRERGQEEQRRQMRGLDAGLAHDHVAHPGRLAAEALAHVVLAPERLHHLDADDRLVGRLGHVALGRLHVARDRHHEVGEAPGDEPDQRRGDGRVERQPRVHERQHDHSADDHHRALEALDDAPADEVADREEVVRRTRDDLSGRVQVVERPREAQVAGVEQLPQAGLEADADARRGVSAGEVDPETDDRDREDRNHVGPERAGCLGTIASSIARWISTETDSVRVV